MTALSRQPVPDLHLCLQWLRTRLHCCYLQYMHVLTILFLPFCAFKIVADGKLIVLYLKAMTRLCGTGDA